MSFPSALSVSMLEQLPGISSVLGCGEHTPPSGPRPLRWAEANHLQPGVESAADDGKNLPELGGNLWWEKRA